MAGRGVQAVVELPSESMKKAELPGKASLEKATSGEH
jgi:hypothetical protein